MNCIILILLFISPIITISYAGRRSSTTGGVLKRHNRQLGRLKNNHNIGHKVPFIESSGGHIISYHESVYGHGVRVYDKYPRFNYSALQYKLKHRTELTHDKYDSHSRAPYMSHIYGYGVPYHYHHHRKQQQPQDRHKPQPRFNATAIDVICNTPHIRHAFDRLGIDICKHIGKPHHDNKDTALPHHNPLTIDKADDHKVPFDKTDGHKVPFDDKTPPNPDSLLDTYCKDSHHHKLFDKHRITICEDYDRRDTDPIVILKSYCENEQQIESLTRIGIKICEDYKHYILPQIIDKKSHHRNDASS